MSVGGKNNKSLYIVHPQMGPHFVGTIYSTAAVNGLERWVELDYSNLDFTLVLVFQYLSPNESTIKPALIVRNFPSDL